MPYEAVVMGRRSIRGYLDKPVPQQLIEEIVGLAIRSPTSMNTQPWHFHVITGKPLDRIRKGNTERILAGEPDSREFRKGKPFAGAHRERQIEVAKQLFAEMKIERHDKDARQDWVLRGFRQFDAPVSIVVCFDKDLGEKGDAIAHFDLGAVTFGLVSAAWSRGLGCVINGQGIMQSPVVREHARIPDDQLIMTCVAMGFPNPDFPANSVISTRRPVEEVATFVGWDETADAAAG